MTCGMPDGGCFSLSALPSIRLSASSIRSPLSREVASAAGAGSLTAAGSTRLVNLLLLISVLSCRVQHLNTPTPDFPNRIFSAFAFQMLGVLECWSFDRTSTEKRFVPPTDGSALAIVQRIQSISEAPRYNRRRLAGD